MFWPKLPAMEELLTRIEEKVAHLIAQCEALRRENRELHQRLDHAEEENSRLVERMREARARLEALSDRLPSP